MKTCHGAILLALVPGVLHPQMMPRSQPLTITSPGIVARLERFDALPLPNALIVTGFVLDRTGFLWCRSTRGLARFDGYELKVYGQDPAERAGEFRSGIEAIAVDGDGLIWGGTRIGGLQRVDPVTGRSRWYKGSLDDPTSIGPGATQLLVTSDGRLWAGAQYGLALYDREHDTFIRYPLPADCPKVEEGVEPAGYIITSLCELGRSIWVGLHGGGLAELNENSGAWKRYTGRESDRTGPCDSIVRAVFADQTGSLWVGTRNSGLHRHDPRTGSWDHFSVSKDGILPLKDTPAPKRSSPVWEIVDDDNGGLWISTGGVGVFRFDPVTLESIHFCHDSTDGSSLPHDAYGNLSPTRFKQPEGSTARPPTSDVSIIWLQTSLWGTGAASTIGIPRFLVWRNPCTSVVARNWPGHLAVIGGISHKSPGKTWASLFNGFLGYFDTQTRTVKWHPDHLQGILRMFRLRDGTLLVRTRVKRAWEYDTNREVFVPFLPDLRITAVHEMNDSVLWLGCVHEPGTSYLAALNRRTGRYTVYPRQDSDSASHRGETILTLCNDDRGGLWYGTTGGALTRFDVERKTYRRYAITTASDNTFIADRVHALVPDSAGSLWVGSNCGLALMDCEGGTLVPIHARFGPGGGPDIRDMADDHEGHLWIAANDGAYCFTKKSRVMRILQTPPQFPNWRFWSVVFEPQTRSVTFGGADGFFTFPLDDPPIASIPSPVVLTSFNVFEKPYPLEAELWSLTSVTLPYSASFFSFTFSVLDYVDPAKNQYAYRLEGFDDDWTYAGSRHYVSYSNLDPGTYRLRVLGANSRGVWGEQEAALDIIILPPWYRTYWAYGAYLLAFGGLLYLLRTFDQRQAALKHSLEMKSFESAKMRELDQMKSAFFANISHEFRTPLTLILGPLEQFAERFRNDERAQSTLATMRRNGLRLLQLINQLLDLSRMDAGKMTLHVRPLELVALSRLIVVSFASLAESRRIHLMFDPEDDEVVAYSDRDKFEKILTNLLSNALKFTGDGGEVRVLLRSITWARGGEAHPDTRHRGVELVVSDTGVGIEPEHLGQIFDRFYQVDPIHASDRGGTGIGLALTKELVELLKGEMSVESSPGRGSTFAVRLPAEKELWSPADVVTEEIVPAPSFGKQPVEAVSEGEAPPATAGTAAPGEEKAGKPTILLVEDNGDVRAYIQGFLGEHYRIVEAVNGAEALKHAHETTIELVVSDIMMPVMDGIALCRALKNDDTTSHIPVILLTARASREGKLEGLDTGADEYLIKPFDAGELTARVRNLIELRRRLREKYRRQITIGPSQMQVTSLDERFLKKLSEHIDHHIADADYDTEALAHDMCMSRMQLNRKIHALTGHSTHELVREFRLQRAAELLRNRADNVTGIAYDVGFISLSHFARAFRERFGVVPSEYAARMTVPDADGKND